jgi:hypothetical protein
MEWKKFLFGGLPKWADGLAWVLIAALALWIVYRLLG